MIQLELTRDSFVEYLSSAQSMSVFSVSYINKKNKLAEIVGFIKELRSLRDEASGKDDAEANFYLEMIMFAVYVQKGLQMWLNLEEKNFSEAWDNLIDAQTTASKALYAGFDEDLFNSLYIISDSWERCLFPKQDFFVSIGMIIKKLECKICNGNALNCEHIQGMAYKGRLCFYSVTELIWDHMSVVIKPDDKKSRIVEYTSNGEIFDTLTREKIGNHSNPNADREIKMSMNLKYLDY